MRPLIVFLNELSTPLHVADLPHGGWRVWAKEMYGCLRAVAQHHSNYKVGIPLDLLEATLEGRPIRAWLIDWLGRDGYRWLLNRLTKTLPLLSADSEIHMNAQSTAGMAHAHDMDSWCVSFPITDSPWVAPCLDAHLVCLTADGLTETTCEIRNLATTSHVVYWQARLITWGAQASGDFCIATFGELCITMYPNDHLPPHIHLVNPATRIDIDGRIRRQPVARYRIDRFERLSGKPGYDREIEAWVAKHIASLMRCWQTCQLGERPFRIE
jgi:hypothetical protein